MLMKYNQVKENILNSVNIKIVNIGAQIFIK